MVSSWQLSWAVGKDSATVSASFGIFCPKILMFLDLKDSTKIAEELGHIEYSKFIQDCFIDLNKV